MLTVASLFYMLDSFLASGDFCRLLITFANSLDPDQDRQNVGPDLNKKTFDTLMLLPKEYFEKSNVEKYLQMTTKT